MKVVFDDMGSLDMKSDGKIRAYGTETGAFVRLDDLQPGFAFGNMDRAIIHSPHKINARAIIPVTTQPPPRATPLISSCTLTTTRRLTGNKRF